MTYAQLTRFMLPLVLTALVQELSGQFLNGGMARMPPKRWPPSAWLSASPPYSPAS